MSEAKETLREARQVMLDVARNDHIECGGFGRCRSTVDRAAAAKMKAVRRLPVGRNFARQLRNRASNKSAPKDTDLRSRDRELELTKLAIALNANFA